MDDAASTGEETWPGAVRGVRTLDHRALTAACRELRAAVLADAPPDVVIGIGTGGGRVAQELAALSDGAWPVLALGLRRPSTGVKVRYRRAGRLLARLPVPVRDRLRLLEHRRLTKAGRPGSEVDPVLTEPGDLAVIHDWCAGAGAGPTPTILVVDDAVDTGATLARALELIAREVPPSATVRTAVITVTTTHPVVAPDHAVFHGWLCRFPWAMDA